MKIDIFKMAAMISLCVMSSACATPDNTTSISSLSANDESRIDSVFQMFSGDVPGASVMIAKGDELIFCKGYGLAVIESDQPVTCDTNFRIASLSKQFTALAILQLIDKGELNFETTLQDIFPDFPEYGQDITIAHLLTHEAGLADYSVLRRTDGQDLTGEDVLNHLFTLDTPQFPAGSKWSYSNTAYIILPEIITEITGQSFDAYMEENVFGPSGMTNTKYPFPLEDITNRAIGYTIKGDSVTISDQTHATTLMGDGSIYTSGREYFQWHKARVNAILLSEKMNVSAYTKQTDGDVGYGYGWFVPNDPDPKFYHVEHGGSSYGFVAFSAWIPSEDISVAIFANQRLTDDNINTLNLNSKTRFLLNIATDGEFALPENY